MNKAMIDSYLRNLLGVVLALVTTTMASSGVASPLDFGLGEWLELLMVYGLLQFQPCFAMPTSRIQHLV